MGRSTLSGYDCLAKLNTNEKKNEMKELKWLPDNVEARRLYAFVRMQ